MGDTQTDTGQGKKRQHAQIVGNTDRSERHRQTGTQRLISTCGHMGTQRPMGTHRLIRTPLQSYGEWGRLTGEVTPQT